MTMKLFLRLMCMSIMLSLLAFSRPTGSSHALDATCQSSCFDDYLYCMNNGPDKSECYAIWDACQSSCP
jgi:hypothetical protein